MSSCHKALAVVRTSSQRSKQDLEVRAAQIGLHDCIVFMNKTLINSNKIIHIVTLRHNSIPRKELSKLKLKLKIIEPI